MERTLKSNEEFHIVQDSSDRLSNSNEEIVDVETIRYEDQNWADDLLNFVHEEKSVENDKHPTNLQEFISSDDFLQAISTPVDKSRGEIFLMIMKFSITNHLSTTAMINLFKLINTIFESPILPESRYIMDKILNPQDDVEFHAVCPECSAYVGEFGKIPSPSICGVCKSPIDVSNQSNLSFFVLINPSRQISDLLHQYEDHYQFVTKERSHKRNYIEDIYDGKKYREFLETLPLEEKSNYVTAVLNTDGAPKFKSSKMSIWPVFMKINELPQQDRINNLITCGLWFNRKKPVMTVFLDQFVNLINTVAEERIPCNILGEERLVKLFVINCCVDSQARAPMQGVKQSNGSYGCNWCLHPAIYGEGSMRYPILDPPPENRKHDETVKLMHDATPENPLFGVKTPSALINLEGLDIVDSFVPDYMHCCLEGVACQITTYFEKLITKNDLETIDIKMKKITAPNQVARLCRPFSMKNDYKAREWENFVLYYSVPIFMGIIPETNFEHWLLFVEALYILLQNSITVDEINRADILLHTFVVRTRGLYGLKAMTYNVHQLLHISESVLNWGPLWTNSTFCFESGNYYFLRAIKCSRGVTQQIVRYIKLNHAVSIAQECLRRSISDEVTMFCNGIETNKITNATRTKDVVYFGRKKYITSEIFADLQLSESTTFYNKIIKDRCLYESCHKSKTRSNNSFAQLTDGTFIRISYFIYDEERDRELTVCNFVSTRKCFPEAFNMLQIVENIGDERHIFETQYIDRICVFMAVQNTEFLCPLPNSLHY